MIWIISNCLRCNPSNQQFFPCHLSHQCLHSCYWDKTVDAFRRKFLIVNMKYLYPFSCFDNITRISCSHMTCFMTSIIRKNSFCFDNQDINDARSNSEIWHASTDNKNLILKQIINWKNRNSFYWFYVVDKMIWN